MQTPTSRAWFDARGFKVVAFSDVAHRDGYGWELVRLPQEVTAEAFLDDTTGAFTFRCLTTAPLPFEVVHRFALEASEAVPPRP